MGSNDLKLTSHLQDENEREKKKCEKKTDLRVKILFDLPKSVTHLGDLIFLF